MLKTRAGDIIGNMPIEPSYTVVEFAEAERISLFALYKMWVPRPTSSTTCRP
jgi:hypothetical protein